MLRILRQMMLCVTSTATQPQRVKHQQQANAESVRAVAQKITLALAQCARPAAPVLSRLREADLQPTASARRCTIPLQLMGRVSHALRILLSPRSTSLIRFRMLEATSLAGKACAASQIVVLLALF